MLHHFDSDISDIELPKRFNNPYHYTPHRLCRMAADEVRKVVEGNRERMQEIATAGKMFGVLVVRAQSGEVGFLAAFSGLLGGSNVQPFFVPPVYDMLHPDGYFKQGEAYISQINAQIDTLLGSEEYVAAMQQLNDCRASAAADEEALRCSMKIAKERRAALRPAATPEQLLEFERESQFQKAELKRLSKRLRKSISDAEAAVAVYGDKIKDLKEERKRLSAELQEWLFSRFVVYDACGNSKNLLQIFKEQRGCLPPAGAGECAAPKLLQYAYLNKLTPLCMAEFWIGAPPSGELRRDGCYYGSCKGKCEPILNFMLGGLDVEESALEKAGDRFEELDIVYEDEYILVADKPAGMLSAPGLVGGRSVQEWLTQHCGKEIFVAHRLDMSTSGLLVAAKSKEILKTLQRAFATGAVEKEYNALLDGVPACESGEISLPIAPDYMNRPRCMVDYSCGKPAVTHYKLLSNVIYDGRRCSLLALFPLTGRTHQLRVHCAHPDGLDTPIVGDELYGRPAARLMLHARRLAFVHPVTGAKMEVVSRLELL